MATTEEIVNNYIKAVHTVLDITSAYLQERDAQENRGETLPSFRLGRSIDNLIKGHKAFAESDSVRAIGNFRESATDLMQYITAFEKVDDMLGGAARQDTSRYIKSLLTIGNKEHTHDTTRITTDSIEEALVRYNALFEKKTEHEPDRKDLLGRLAFWR